MALAATHDLCYSLGVHPAHADEFSPGTLDALASLVETGAPVAIGEIGLDFSRPGPSAAQQEMALRAQLRLAAAIGLPAIIHQRAAEAQIIRLFESEPELPRLVLHSFDGGAAYARFASVRGALVGVGGLATRRSSCRLRETLATFPPDVVVLETDAPYLVPAGIRDRRNVPANLPAIADWLAPLWGLAASDLAALTTASARAAFRLPVVAGTAG